MLIWMKNVRLHLIIPLFAFLLLIDIGVNSNDHYSAYRVDVSWPNCAKRLVNFNSGIIGVTGGLDFHPNKCLAQETGSLLSYQLYENTGYPGPHIKQFYQRTPIHCRPGNLNCEAYNYGYNSSLYAIRQASLSNAHSTVWWLDVETENSWSAYPSVNVDDLKGAAQAIEDNIFLAKVGFYSYPDQWKAITGSWKNAYPAWVATGTSNIGSAFKACTLPAFNDGRVVLSQFTMGLDINISCLQPQTSLKIYQNQLD
ncbi:MAG TPA: hypothetical protein VFN51_02900 [Candidatus Saccharimonadales bacterium]|nr:hypothetical protein [Candidatus Saccharimonadales bacterium]